MLIISLLRAEFESAFWITLPIYFSVNVCRVIGIALLLFITQYCLLFSAKDPVNSSTFSLELVVNLLLLKIVSIHGTFLFRKDLNTDQYPLGLVDGSKNVFDKQKEYWKLQKWWLLLLLLLKRLYAFFYVISLFSCNWFMWNIDFMICFWYLH